MLPQNVCPSKRGLEVELREVQTAMLPSHFQNELRVSLISTVHFARMHCTLRCEAVELFTKKLTVPLRRKAKI